jgi:hypothetical protein
MTHRSNDRRLAWWPFTVLLLFAQAAFAGPPLREIIDSEIRAAWQREKISPAGPASDAEFLRRVSLDIVGVIPTHDETVAFLADPSPDKRRQLIDRLLDDPRYAKHMAELWDVLLFTRNPPGSEADKRDGIQKWLQKRFAENTPYDKLVRELLKAEGNSVEQGPPLYFVQYRQRPEDMTEAVTQTFLGVQLQCARCHNHPFEPWTQQDFYGMAAFLARLQIVTAGKVDNQSKLMVAEKSTGDILFTGSVKDDKPGKKGDPVAPKFLLAADVLTEPPLPEGFKEVAKFEENKPPPSPVFSRKDQLAEWITRADNPYFARATANRMWAMFLGRGLVHPVDNLSDANKPSHPELLDAIARELVEHQFDLKWLIRELCNSQTYQLSSVGPESDPMPRWFQQARVRPLSAEELMDSWKVATGFESSLKPDAKKKEGRFSPIDGGYMLRFFGQPNTGTGDFQGGLAEHLFLNNGPVSQLIVTNPGSLHDSILKSSSPWNERIDRLFVALLNRTPTEEEHQKFSEFFTTDEKMNPERVRDAIWALMTCSEFRFNH